MESTLILGALLAARHSQKPVLKGRQTKLTGERRPGNGFFLFESANVCAEIEKPGCYTGLDLGSYNQHTE
jgi:hypothetical protein